MILVRYKSGVLLRVFIDSVLEMMREMKAKKEAERQAALARQDSQPVSSMACYHLLTMAVRSNFLTKKCRQFYFRLFRVSCS